MSSQEQRQQPQASSDDKGVEMLILAVGLLTSWPALLVAVGIRGAMRKWLGNQFVYWVALFGLAVVGVMFLFMRLSPIALFQAEAGDTVTLLFHWNSANLHQFLAAALPLWVRTLLVAPAFSVLMQVFSPTNLHTKLLEQERQRRATHEQRRKRAERRVRHAPNQIDGEGVLGVLIEDPKL